MIYLAHQCRGQLTRALVQGCWWKLKVAFYG
jgi:hypothetical protein